MSTLRELYGRFRQLIHEGAKFLVVGGIGTVVTFGVANALHSTGPYKAITVATILATIVTFLGNRYWSFSQRESTSKIGRETVTFLVLNGVGLLIYWACILPAEHWAHGNKLWYNMALVVGTGLGTLFRFWSYRKWVWVAAGDQPPAIGADEPESVEAFERELAGAAEVVGRAPAGATSSQPANTSSRPPGAHRRH